MGYGAQEPGPSESAHFLGEAESVSDPWADSGKRGGYFSNLFPTIGTTLSERTVGRPCAPKDTEHSGAILACKMLDGGKFSPSVKVFCLGKKKRPPGQSFIRIIVRGISPKML